MVADMPNFVQLVNAYSINGKTIFNQNKLLENLQSVLKAPDPCLIDCQIIKDDNCYPMVIPVKSNSQMIGLVKSHEIPITGIY
jgi:acetolactate synthase-1/2/3 large subunit